MISSTFGALNISNFVILPFRIYLNSKFYLSQKIVIVTNQVTNHFQKQNFQQPQFSYPQRVSLSCLFNDISRVSSRGRRLPGVRLRNIKLPFNPVKNSKTFPRASGLESPLSVGLYGILNSTRYFSFPSSSAILSLSYLFYIHEILSIQLYSTNSLFSILC